MRRAGLREVYIVAAGVVLGVLLGPAVSGRWAGPMPFGNGIFVPDGQRYAFWEYRSESAQQLVTLHNTGVTPEAVAEHRAMRAEGEGAIIAAMQASADRRAARLLCVGVALLCILMLLDALRVGRRVPWVTLSYGVVALMLAVMLARPTVWWP